MSTDKPVVNLELLKAGGFIKQKQPELFSVRIRIPLGNVSSAQLLKVAELASDYGRGVVHLTVRQGIEIPHIHFRDFNAVTAGLGSAGLDLGACGSRVRVVTACQGTALCPHGVGDTESLARKLDERFYGQSGLPHKIKMGVTGCPNSCIKPQENDLGYIGVVEPFFSETEAECINCGLCEEVCTSGAISLIDGKPVIDLSRCSYDAKCISSCPTGSIRPGREGWNVFVGGKWGKEPQIGVLFKEFASEGEALQITEDVIGAFRKLAGERERLGSLINRIGLDAFKDEVLHVRD